MQPTSPPPPGTPPSPPGFPPSPPGTPPSPPGFPPGAVDPESVAHEPPPILRFVERNGAVLSQIMGLLSETLGPRGQDEVRADAEAGRQRFVLRAMKQARKIARDAAFYEAAGARATARVLLEQLVVLVSAPSDGRLDDDAAEARRMAERASVLVPHGAAEPAGAFKPAKAKGRRKKKPAPAKH